MQSNKKNIIRGLMVLVIITMFMSFLNTQQKEKNKTQAQISYSEFIERIKSGKITDVEISEQPGGSKQLKILNTNGVKDILIAPFDTKMIDLLLEKKIKIVVKETKPPSMFLGILIAWFPIFLLIGVWIYFAKKSSGGKGGMFGFGKSKLKLIEKTNVSFVDVIGCEEAKEEVSEIVDFLKNPDKFTKLGAKIPKGVLLTGPAGTGKTMLAKAIASEAGVPFFSISGSDFVEMFVGVGAARVRDMFAETKKHSPCILFIDEIDALGQKRSGNGLGGNDEREQTLNQMLVEMDGIDGNTGVIIIGATNRPDTLDTALLRPGRFDRQVVVNLPDVHGREKILASHSKNVPLEIKVELIKIAKGTPGFSGAELANLVNEAAIFATRRNKKYVDQSDFESAKDKIIMGPERKSMAMPENEKINTAYHESGHAVVAKLLPNADPVHKVTIIPRGRALGVTMQLPSEERYAHDKEYFIDMIKVLMGGRLAEEIFLKHITTGASNDIERASNIARRMVTEWGMSDLGPLAFGDRTSGGFLGSGQTNMQNLAQETMQKIDNEVHKIVTEQYNIAKQILEENRDKVEAMAKALLENETIDDWQIQNIIEGNHYKHNLSFFNPTPSVEIITPIQSNNDIHPDAKPTINT